jgi:hypothetical protein
LEPAARGAYVVTLSEKATRRLLRTNTIRLDSGEKTKSIRGLPVVINWDATETSVDVTLDGEFLIRVAVPAIASNTNEDE